MDLTLQGKGRYIKEAPRRINLHLTGKTSFTEKMTEAGFQLKTENLGCERISFEESIYNSLGAGPEESIFRISRLRIVDGEPLAILLEIISTRLKGRYFPAAASR